ncbi:MAG: hypothetical protein ABSG49_09130 [Methanoregula sp.]|jgi:hypothetical protein|uniref:hypothetical protein n=1 Tax=Methanoregula sp. TaxID=2052170 RepID=UPI003C19D9C7
MKRILLIILLLIGTVGTASAYNIYLKCPDSVQAGVPLKCSLDSNFPAGTTFNLVLYHTQYTATQIRNQPVTIQSDHNTQYLVTDTTGLPGGQYKLEVQYTSAVEPSSDSTILQLITIVDRSTDIEITSPVSQDLKDALRIEGNIANGGNDGVEIEVSGPDGRIFGPQWIQTKADIKNNAGVFTQKVDVSSSGDYQVDFTDAKGFIGEKAFTVVAPTAQPTAVATTTAAVVKTTRTITTTAPTPWPTTAKSPLSPFAVMCSLAGAGMLIVLMRRRAQ